MSRSGAGRAGSCGSAKEEPGDGSIATGRTRAVDVGGGTGLRSSGGGLWGCEGAAWNVAVGVGLVVWDRGPANSASAPSLQGSKRGAWRRRRRSKGRCHRPWRPGRLPAAGASKRIAPGLGHSKAAVVLE